MKELVHKYLTENYYIKSGWIYKKRGSLGRDVQIIVDELVIIFELTIDEIKEYFDEWAEGLDSDQFWVKKQPPNTITLKSIRYTNQAQINWVTQEEFKKISRLFKRYYLYYINNWESGFEYCFTVKLKKVYHFNVNDIKNIL